MRPIPSPTSLPGRRIMRRLLLMGVGGLAFCCIATTPAQGASSPTIHSVPHIPGVKSLGDISCPSVSFCAALADHGSIATSTEPTGSASAWAVTRVDHHNSDAISCPTASFCAVVDEAGNLLTSTDPSGGRSAWKSAHIASTRVRPPRVVQINGHKVRIPPRFDQFRSEAVLTDVSCPSPSLCVAVDSRARVFTSTGPTAGPHAWKVVQPNLNPLYWGGLFGDFWSVSCPSSFLCVAVDSYGNVISSRNPTGGRAAWRVTHLSRLAGPPPTRFPPFPTKPFPQVSCPSPALCVGVRGRGIFASTRPAGSRATWKVWSIRGPLTAISCPSTLRCFAIEGGRRFVAIDPIDRRVRTIATSIERFTAISCPSTGLCVAAGESGEILAVVEPAPPLRAIVRRKASSSAKREFQRCRQLLSELREAARLKR